MMTTNKRYSLINKNTGNIRTSRATRAAARAFKRANGFRFKIFDNVNQQVVR